jgi:hypothetical protein
VHRLLFRSAIFLASFLLFLSEPIAARQLLPIFGGSAAVWITCLVFFQTALLAGYLYAHLLTRIPSPRAQSAIHTVLLVCALIPAMAWSLNRLPRPAVDTSPVASIFRALTLSIGLPFLVLASTSPLLQFWLARREHNAVPYRLFALSNLASLLALLSYPTLIEPHLTLSLQRTLWTSALVIFTLLTAAIALQHRPVTQPTAHNPQPTRLRSRLFWFLLPMAASMQLAAVTAYLTSNIAAIPLLWILPLAVYLLTFILAFQYPALARQRGNLLKVLAVLLISLGLFLSHPEYSLPVGMAIIFFLIETFAACLFLHTEACALRPAATADSTLFYLTLAAGGAFGAFLIGIAAPFVFAGNYDLSLTFVLAAALAATLLVGSGRLPTAVWSGIAALLLFFVFSAQRNYQRQTLLATRNFYGSLRVKQSVTDHGDPIRTLLNGTIQHGTQIFSPDLRHIPTTYYAPNSGIGFALNLCRAGRPRNIGVIGLGAGTLAAYGKPGDTIRFYEINPAVQPIAQHLFTWLSDSPARIAFVPGDARASLAAEPPEHFDVLAVDAFSGDAIPLHLLTIEALALYRHHLAPNGILAFHVSNQYVDLAPEIARLAASADLQSRLIASEEDVQSGESRADWVLVTANQAFLDQIDAQVPADRIPARPGLRPWTDDYSSLLPLVHWR